jgi:hypothetical protein
MNAIKHEKKKNDVSFVRLQNWQPTRPLPATSKQLIITLWPSIVHL